MGYRVAIPAIGTNNLHPLIARHRQVLACGACQILINIDCDNSACFTDDVGHQCSIVASSCADFENFMTGLQAKLLQHDCHYGWL